MGDERIDFTEERGRYASFVGRQAVLKELDRLLAAVVKKGGSVLVSGGPGTGKSALLCELLRRREAAPGATALPCHFFRASPAEWADPFRASRSLAAQVEALFPDLRRDAEAQLPERLGLLLKRISDARLCTPKAPLYLVVDALDEASDSGSDNRLGRVLPSSIPPGVGFLFSSRPRNPPIISGAALLDLSADRWQQDSRDACLLCLKGCAAELHLSAAFIDEAVQAGDGNLLYTVALLSWLRGPPQREPAVDTLPRGLSGYLEQIWSELTALPGELAQRARRGLGLLAVAEEPLPVALMASLLGWPEPATSGDAFRAATESFLYKETQELGIVYRPFHASFREFVRERLESEQPGALQELHGVLAAALAPWPLPAPNTPAARFQRRYTLRHGLRHRIAASRQDAVALATDLDYLVLRCAHEGPHGLAADLELADAQPQSAETAESWEELNRAFAEQGHQLLRHPAALPAVLYMQLVCRAWSREQIERTLHPVERLPRLRLEHAPPGLAAGWDRTLTGHRGRITCVQVMPDGKQAISASTDTTLKIWNLESGREASTLSGHESAVIEVLLSGDGARLISREASGAVKLWDLAASRELPEHELKAAVTTWALLPDGVRCAVLVSDKSALTLKIWNLESGREESSTTLLASPVEYCLLCSACAVATFQDESGERAMRAWDLASGAVLFTRPDESWEFEGCELVPGGQHLLFGSMTDGLQLCELASGKTEPPFLDRAELLLFRVLPGPDPGSGRALVASGNGGLTAYELASQQELFTLRTPAKVTACAVTPDGRQVLSGHEDCTLRLWDLSSVDTEGSAQGANEGSPIAFCTISPDETRAATAAEDGTVKIWELERGGELLSMQGSFVAGRLCRWSPDGERFVVAWSTSVDMWETGQGKRLFSVPLEDEVPSSRRIELAWPLLLFLKDEKELVVWDLTEPDQAPKYQHALPDLGLANPETIEGVVTASTATPQGLFIYAQMSWRKGGPHMVPLPDTLSVLEPRTGQLLFRTNLPETVVGMSVAQSGAELIVQLRDGRWSVIELATYREVRALRGPEVPSSRDQNGSLAAAPGEVAVSIVDDRLIVRDMGLGRYLEELPFPAPVRCLSASAHWLCAGDERGNRWLFKWPDASASAGAGAAIQRRQALLIGVNHYDAGPALDLRFAVNDAEALSQTLGQLGYEVTALHDQAGDALLPTRDHILEQLARKRESTELLLVQLSCHGVRIAGEVYLLVRDSVWLEDDAAVREHALPLTRVLELMAASGARHNLLFLDACHTGEAAPPQAGPALQASGRVAILAGSAAQQQALERTDRSLGAFTSFIIDALSPANEKAPFPADDGECPKGYVTLDDLAAFVIAGVDAWSRTISVKVQSPSAELAGCESLILADRR